jgi:hypothetical protein
MRPERYILVEKQIVIKKKEKKPKMPSNLFESILGNYTFRLFGKTSFLEVKLFGYHLREKKPNLFLRPILRILASFLQFCMKLEIK